MHKFAHANRYDSWLPIQPWHWTCCRHICQGLSSSLQARSALQIHLHSHTHTDTYHRQTGQTNSGLMPTGEPIYKRSFKN